MYLKTLFTAITWCVCDVDFFIQGGTQLSGGVFLIERIIDQILSCPLASVKVL